MTEKENYIEYWKEKWLNGQTFFHRNKINTSLEKNFDKILGKNGRILFPCCGKAIDMAWMASLNHQVVGVEVSQLACEEFFKENSLKYSVIDLDEFKLFKNEDGRIRIYNGDIFKFNLKYEKAFTSVWDRGAYVALPKSLRDIYPLHIKSLLDENTQYLLDIVEYEQSLYTGPPFSITYNELIKNFGEIFNCELIEQKEIKPCHPGMNRVGTMKESVYLLNIKN